MKRLKKLAFLFSSFIKTEARWSRGALNEFFDGLGLCYVKQRKRALEERLMWEESSISRRNIAAAIELCEETRETILSRMQRREQGNRKVVLT